jgi:hypothetical protein
VQSLNICPQDNLLQLLLPAFQRELLHRLTTRQIMRPRDDCIINNNNGNWYFAFQKPFQLPAKPLHKVFSENIFHQQKIHLFCTFALCQKFTFKYLLPFDLRQLDEVQLPQLAQNYVILLLI